MQKHGKVPYKARLQSSGVAFISMEDVKVVKKTATGPVSGSVFKAIWTKPNGEKVRFQPRYISFIKSAGMDIITWGILPFIYPMNREYSQSESYKPVAYSAVCNR